VGNVGVLYPQSIQVVGMLEVLIAHSYSRGIPSEAVLVSTHFASLLAPT
jgi:hypothetical protein